MKRAIIAVAALLLFVSAVAFAAAPKTYQVTGPVVEVKDDMIVVDKDGEKWQIARTKDTKATGDVKVGAKVTVKYTMSAASIEVKK